MHSYDAFHTRHVGPGVKGIIGMHRFNICLVVVLSVSCSGVKNHNGVQPDVQFWCTARCTVLVYSPMYSYSVQPSVQLRSTARCTVLVYSPMYSYSVQPGVQFWCTARCTVTVYSPVYSYSVQPDVQLRCTARCTVTVYSPMYSSGVQPDVQLQCTAQCTAYPLFTGLEIPALSTEISLNILP